MLAVVEACALGCVVTGTATGDFWGCGVGFTAVFDVGLGRVVLAGNGVCGVWGRACCVAGSDVGVFEGVD